MRKVPPRSHAAFDHGGDLSAARKAYPQAPEPWLDLSTGVSPYAYPFAPLPPGSWTRLPQSDELLKLEAAARLAYRVPPLAEIVAAPGSQAVINWLPHLYRVHRAGILGRTYSEHVRSWSAAGAVVTVVEDVKELETQDVAAVVNPNNPDGRLLPVEALIRLARTLGARGGLVVVDEAFADFFSPAASVLPAFPEEGLVVLRSFGKAYGLPGLRLGFAIAPKSIAEKLRHALDPWPVSSAAIAIGSVALADRTWVELTRAQLAAQGEALDRLLAAAGFEIVGATPLFRLVRHEDAQGVFHQLASAGILARRFPERADWLRFSIPASKTELDRLGRILLHISSVR
ncbi:MAG TPA: threonine-phosphate decarboxylase CobD [Methylocella sp.]|nr:threonine-phosphate decarboxylase CobD [Methylocella sp.]